MKRFYITFNYNYIASWNNGPEWVKERYAIECFDESELKKAYAVVNCVEGLDYIRINRCGKISEDAKVLTLVDFIKKF